MSGHGVTVELKRVWSDEKNKSKARSDGGGKNRDKPEVMVELKRV